MDNKIKKLTKSFSYTFLANILSMIISIALILIVPGFVGAYEYGYLQLYIFFTSYIAYMSLGLTDGAYLRYGGCEYGDLEKNIFVSQFWFLVMFNIVVNFTMALIYWVTSGDINKNIVVLMTCITGVLIVPRSLLTFMLQATNRIREFSIIIIVERIIYFILVVILLAFGARKFQYVIYADIIGKLISILYSFSACKELVFGKFASIRTSAREIWLNITVGAKLLFANFASMIIIGIVRLSIEKHWSIETFGKVSLTLSISNMLMLFIDAVAVVLFPTLRRTSKESLPDIYKTMRSIIMIPLLGLLIFYYPAKAILSDWLPEYAESLTFMALLFPMCLYESKIILLINTYLKTLRREKLMLIINFITVFISIILTFISTIMFNNLILAILTIVILLAFRCIIAELCLSKILKIEVKKDILLELFMTIIFISVSFRFSISRAFIIYLIAYIFYLIVKKKDIICLLKSIRVILKYNH